MNTAPLSAEPGAGPPNGRQWTPVIDQHASWLAVNPIQGCPKKCAYCFLDQRGSSHAPKRPMRSISVSQSERRLVWATSASTG